MARLIFVPQYPTPLRYQEWWFDQFPQQLLPYFDYILVLGREVKLQTPSLRLGKSFAPFEQAIEFELEQIRHYTEEVQLQQDDVLLLNDLSYPGLFANILFHKKPERCFAICHATSKNRYDYFSKVRDSKYPVEKGIAHLFNKVFVGSQYHADKLNWPNTKVLYLPIPTFVFWKDLPGRFYAIASVARNGVQKRNQYLESRIEKELGLTIKRANCTTWEDYYSLLFHSKMLLITSKEETFGYQVVDAILNGCVPIAPRTCSYPELLPDAYLYDSYEELQYRIYDVMSGQLKVPELKIENKSKQFFKLLANEMLQNA